MLMFQKYDVFSVKKAKFWKNYYIFEDKIYSPVHGKKDALLIPVGGRRGKENNNSHLTTRKNKIPIYF